MDIKLIKGFSLSGIKAFGVLLASYLTAENLFSKYNINTGIRGASTMGFMYVENDGDNLIADLSGCDNPVNGYVSLASDEVITRSRGFHIALCQKDFIESFLRYDLGGFGDAFTNSKFVKWVLLLVKDKLAQSMEQKIWGYGKETGDHWAGGLASATATAADFPEVLTDGDGRLILLALHKAQTLELKAAAKKDKTFHVTGAVYDQYLDDVENGCCSEGSYRAGLDGIDRLTFRGIEVVPHYDWVAQATSFNTKPHGYLVMNQALGAAFDGFEGATASFDVYYDRGDNKVHIKGDWMQGHTVIRPGTFATIQIAV